MNKMTYLMVLVLGLGVSGVSYASDHSKHHDHAEGENTEHHHDHTKNEHREHHHAEGKHAGHHHEANHDEDGHKGHHHEANHDDVEDEDN